MNKVNCMVDETYICLLLEQAFKPRSTIYKEVHAVCPRRLKESTVEPV